MNRIVVKAQDGDARISRHIYGHFSEHLGRCIYGGFWVGNDPEAAAIPNTRGIRNDIVAALRRIRIPNLRWPGGCFADEYHWQDGIGPRAERPRTINNNWGGVTEDNSFGTHEFLDLCGQLGCEPYICGNVGSGTVREFSQWIEYCNFGGPSSMAELRRKNGRAEPWKVRFWGVGNENWGCGGGMTAAFYADNYRRYASYAHDYGEERLYKIACGFDLDWNRVLLEKAAERMDGLSIHYYTIPGEWAKKGSAVEFTEAEWYITMRKAAEMEDMVAKNSALMDEFDPKRRIGLVVDEWGTWLDVEPGTNPGFLYQQNTLRDALVAGLHLNAFNNHAERVFMANIAQTVNVLQAPILTEGPHMLLTPTYHIFDLYKVHGGAVKLPVYVESGSAGGLPALSASASEDGEGRIHLSLINIDAEQEQDLRIELRGLTLSPSVQASGRLLSSEKMTAHNTFAAPDQVRITDFTAFSLSGGRLALTLPPMSAATLELA